MRSGMGSRKGYTVIELLLLLAMLATLAGIGVMVWVLGHFVSKYW